MKNTKRAFTLVEMLIVIVIIGILAAALIPRLTGIQQRARDTSRQADVNQTNQAIQMYAVDNTGNYPTGVDYVGLEALLTNYLSDFPNEARSGQGLDATTCTTAGDNYWYAASAGSGYVVTANLESVSGGNDGTCNDIAAPDGNDGYFTIFGN